MTDAKRWKQTLIGERCEKSAPRMSFFCYILKCADGTYYTGWTTDPIRREREHNAGRGSRYTRSRQPVRLVYVEEHPNRISAMRREQEIKSLTRAAKQRLIFDKKAISGSLQTG